MNIGIFGDSYASENIFEPHNYLGWPEILDHTNVYKVTNYSIPGSNLYFSWKLFIENHKKYDANIFLVTNFGRKYVKAIPDYSRTARHIPNLYTIPSRKSFLKYILDEEEKDRVKNIYDALEKYFIYLQDDECDELVDKALVSYAKTLTDNTIFIPCFDGYEQWPLVEIFREENSKMGAYEMYHSKDIHFGSIVDDYQLTDARVCHMTKRNNEIFAEKIIQAIKEKNFSFKFKKEDFEFDSLGPKDINDYIVWKNINEDFDIR